MASDRRHPYATPVFSHRRRRHAAGETALLESGVGSRRRRRLVSRPALSVRLRPAIGDDAAEGGETALGYFGQSTRPCFLASVSLAARRVQIAFLGAFGKDRVVRLANDIRPILGFCDIGNVGVNVNPMQAGNRSQEVHREREHDRTFFQMLLAFPAVLASSVGWWRLLSYEIDLHDLHAALSERRCKC